MIRRLDDFRGIRDLNTKSESKDASARKSEKVLQSYYDALIKTSCGVNEQFRHKPYQCDIEIK